MEVSGTHLGPGARTSTSGSSSITGGVRSKIRHHGAPKAQQYAPTTNPASGVPMRLSAREVDEDDSDEDRYASRNSHNRNGSARSSVGSAGGRTASGAFGAQYPSGLATGRSSEGSTPPHGNVQEYGPGKAGKDSGAEPTPVPEQYHRDDYFVQRPSSAGRDNSGGSENSERENSFGEVKGLPLRLHNPNEEHDTLDDLHRRGSVDERTTTMKGYGKLFVANPDLSD